MMDAYSTGRESQEKILAVLRENGPQSIREITERVSGHHAWDSTAYGTWSRTISVVLRHLRERGCVTVSSDRDTHGNQIYEYHGELPPRAQAKARMRPGKHQIADLIAVVEVENMVSAVYKDGKPVKIYIQPHVSRFGRRVELEMPVSANNLKYGLRRGYYSVEVCE